MKPIVCYTGILAALVLLFIGCSGDAGPVGPAGPSLSGTLAGNVTLHDTSGTAQFDHGGVSVWIEGISDTMVTDSLGRWRIEDVTTGIYTILLEKAGYGYMKMPSTQFVGGGDLYLGNRDLVMEPSDTVRFTVASFSGLTHTMQFSGAISEASPLDRTALCFVGRQSVDPGDPITYIDTLKATIPAGSQSFSTRQVSWDEPPYMFTGGDTLGLLLFPTSGKLDGYIDPASGKKIFSTGIPAVGTRWNIAFPSLLGSNSIDLQRPGSE